MKKLMLLAFFIGINGFVKAQSNYDAAKIPPSLLTNAVAVVRNEEQFCDFKSPRSAEYTYKVAITILNKAGDEYAMFAETYDKFSSLSNVKAALYDASGKKIKEYKTADFRDQSQVSDYSIFEDNRVKLLKFYSINYPYTIEYSYTQDFKGVLWLPSWQSIKDYGVSTEKSSYIFQKSPTTSVKYLTSNKLKTDSTKVGDKVQYKWVCSNVDAIEQEPMSTGFNELIDWVKVSPNQFEYENTTGNFDSWKNFGAWIQKLNENGTALPPAAMAKVQSLIKNAKTPKEKIGILYDYLQQNTRYVSVQLGIGGFKPIAAEKVSQVNYGDCKALSNYMKAMLKEAGINANLIVLGSGMPSLNATYSSMGQANHMIVCVPLPSDTTYLECTSQHHPMGFIGNDNSDRNVLMITEEGGKIVHTPKYLAKDNYQIRKTKVNLAEDGSAEIGMKATYANAQFEDNMGIYLAELVEQRKMLNEAIDIPGAELISFKYEQANKALPLLTEEINLKSNQILAKGGDKSFLTVNLVNRRENVPKKMENRKTPFAVAFSYQDEDEISYALPKGYKVEFLPKDIEILSEFGTYTAKFVTKENTITYLRTQVMNAKKFPPEKYNEYVDFYKKIYQADKQKAILAKTN
jgi:transglutaminase-like putative cysteine protease/ribosomal protein S18